MSKGFGLWALELPFRAKGSYFWRSSCHFEQRVRTLGAPVAILSKGFGLLALQEGRGNRKHPLGWRFSTVLFIFYLVFPLSFNWIVPRVFRALDIIGPLLIDSQFLHHRFTA